MKPYVLSALEFRHLVALQAIAAAGSYWAAAEQLGRSQSATSQQVTNVEAIAGVRLIDRSRGRRVLALTEAGRFAAPPRSGDRGPAQSRSRRFFGLRRRGGRYP